MHQKNECKKVYHGPLITAYLASESGTGCCCFKGGRATLEVNGDSKKEASESFYPDLFGNCSNSLFTRNRGIGRLLNDD